MNTTTATYKKCIERNKAGLGLPWEPASQE
jgi:hypothetical protein